MISCHLAVKNYIMQYAQGIKNAKILDVGCRYGELTSLFCKNGNKVFGLDLKNNLKPEYRQIKFVKGNAESLPFTNNSFDLIVSFDVLEHVQDDTRVITEMFRVLRKDGEIFLETPNRERLSYWLLVLLGKKRSYPLKLSEECVHLREYRRQELEYKFREKGFKRIKILSIWLGLRGGWFDWGIIKPPGFLKRFCQCLFVKAKK